MEIIFSTFEEHTILLIEDTHRRVESVECVTL